MGQALQRAGRLSLSDSTSKMIQLTPINEQMLKQITEFILKVPQSFPDEANVVFKKPLTWKTSLEFSSFGPGLFIIGSNEVTSVENPDDPLLKLTKDKEDCTLEIRSLKYAEIVLKYADRNKTKEVWSCLSNNLDPLANIFGDRFAVVNHLDTSLIRFCNEIIREIKYNKQIANDVDNEETNNKLHTLNLYIILMQLDDSLLNLYVIKFAEDVRLTPEIVNRELAILKELAQPESEVCALESINYYDEHE
ncbi:Hypothetical predicted protein [Octopus vulgaris]|uniref:Uncharacterized protein n=1 Tax=Octopus vulgaris TaxID=6645 RepID=A0AA36BRJ3_OCTVU|nr:Hypothetical predicted protein [Octopus vulgaris]